MTVKKDKTDRLNNTGFSAIMNKGFTEDEEIEEETASSNTRNNDNNNDNLYIE
jgi:hypothetical protein